MEISHHNNGKELRAVNCRQVVTSKSHPHPARDPCLFLSWPLGTHQETGLIPDLGDYAARGCMFMSPHVSPQKPWPQRWWIWTGSSGRGFDHKCGIMTSEEETCGGFTSWCPGSCPCLLCFCVCLRVTELELYSESKFWLQFSRWLLSWYEMSYPRIRTCGEVWSLSFPFHELCCALGDLSHDEFTER